LIEKCEVHRTQPARHTLCVATGGMAGEPRVRNSSNIFNQCAILQIRRDSALSTLMNNATALSTLMNNATVGKETVVLWFKPQLTLNEDTITTWHDKVFGSPTLFSIIPAPARLQTQHLS
jgi:hypothetical protein